MEPPTSLLTAIGRAVMTAAAGQTSGDFAVEADARFAEAVWLDWRQTSDDARRAEVAALVSLSPSQAEQTAAALAPVVAAGQPPEMAKVVSRYLRHVPSALRRALRRPADPTGQSVPGAWKIRQSQDLQAFLPARLPWFECGDRPFGIGDWELEELTDIGDWGESWKARNPRKLDAPPALLQFGFHSSLKERLRRRTSAEFERIRKLTAQAGWVTLQQVWLQADPPCLQWEHVDACDLCGLVAKWNEEGAATPHREAPALIQQIAGILAPAHQLRPPFVHRAVNPSNILVTQGKDKSLECRIAYAGLGEVWETGSADFRLFNPAVYRSPQQQRGEPAHPHDDVFALGILWYQLLIGDLTVSRPGGSQWRKRLVDGGIPQGQVELLESCLEDDAGYRPSDASALAQKLSEVRIPESEVRSVKAQQPTPDSGLRTPDIISRPAAKKANVWGLLEGLGEKVKEQAKFFVNSLGMKLALIPAGTFLMGSPPTEAGRRDNEGPQHEVQLPNPFYMAIHTVTQGQFQELMGRNPAKFDIAHGGGADHPVENVTWEEAVEFCRRLTEQRDEKSAKRKYRLPTEAEWEYACRAGAITPFAFGPTLGANQANFDGNFPYGGARGLFAEKTVPPGSYTANNYSLCDMHGNVWEWCADWLHSDYYGISPKRNPQGPSNGVFRLLRGGSWRSQAVTCRSAYRNGLSPKSRDKCTGFRVVAEAS